MRLHILFLAGLLSLSIYAQGQLNKINEINIPGLQRVSVDRLGNFYYLLSNGRIQKVDLDGNLLNETQNAYKNLSLIEPWNPLKIFLYSEKDQGIKYLDHHLELLESAILEPSLSISPKLVCPDNVVNNTWIYDKADHSVKKVNLSSLSILVDEILPKSWIDDNTEVVFMREYQNMVFLLDKNKGIFILNNLGIPITQIEINGLSFFNFNGEELCYRNKENVILYDLRTGKSRTVAKLTEPLEISYTIITDERLLVMRGSKVELYEIKI